MKAGLGRDIARTIFAAALLAAAVPLLSQAAVFDSDASGTVEVYGGPTPTSSEMARPGFDKLDGFLLEIARAAAAQPSALAPADFASVSPPQAHFIMQAPRSVAAVSVDMDAVGDPQALLAALQPLDFQRPSVFKDRVGGWLPVNRIYDAAALPGLRFMRLSLSRTRTGLVTSQGDFAMGSYLLRAPFASPGVSGNGVKVGVLSDSFNCLSGTGVDTYATDVSSGDLPAGVQIAEDPDCASGTDEGRAMAQIIYDIAPGTTIAFNTAESTEEDFANGIVALAGAGAKVIVDDVGYYDEPVFQDGIVSQAVDQVEAQGVSYFSAAGNDGQNSFEGPFIDSGIPGGFFNEDALMNFDKTGATQTTILPFTVPAAAAAGKPTTVYFILQWDQPYATGGGPGSNASLDLCLTNGNGLKLYCTLPASGIGNDPVKVLAVRNRSPSAKNYGIEVGLRTGTAPGLVKIIDADDGAGSTINAFQTYSPTVQGHPGAAGAAAVGAAFYVDTPNCGTTPAVAEEYSSWGGDPILFDTAGNRLATPITRLKPDFVAPDGVNTTFFFGFDFSADVTTSIAQCQDMKDAGGNYYPGFFGTSAAAPHAAGVAALLLQAKPTFTPDDVYTALRNSAQDMATPGTDYETGYGFVRANLAVTNTDDSGLPTKDGGGGAFGFGSLLPLLGAAVARRRRQR